MTFNPSITKPIAGMEMFTKSRAAGHSGQPFETNEMGWLVYPEGIYRAVKAIGRYGVPIYITENGIPDKTSKKRARFIADHLNWLKKAIDEGGAFYAEVARSNGLTAPMIRSVFHCRYIA